jgi:hypothetical protein
MAQTQGAAAQPAATAATAATAAGAATRYQAARDEYEVGHFAVAFATFTQLADEGHCEAARMAYQMSRYGRQLYATEFSLSAPRLARWRELPGCNAVLAQR